MAQRNRQSALAAEQALLSNLDQIGFPEWRDHLYIRRPGEKAVWSRRFCVLRQSGLYISKKSHTSLSRSVAGGTSYTGHGASQTGDSSKSGGGGAIPAGGGKKPVPVSYV
ncbi:unnamed protein product [Protopolystoma xenopodis]|uniref:PH domain-containing protein n=1 Tax=Protopolystoma xenopodis TaxID=117903 RepID=A0A3S5B697_9PLAT|nr:unnamed protein product [Protopolystoma xenopodis]